MACRRDYLHHAASLHLLLLAVHPTCHQNVVLRLGVRSLEADIPRGAEFGKLVSS